MRAALRRHLLAPLCLRALQPRLAGSPQRKAVVEPSTMITRLGCRAATTSTSRRFLPTASSSSGSPSLRRPLLVRIRSSSVDAVQPAVRSPFSQRSAPSSTSTARPQLHSSHAALHLQESLWRSKSGSVPRRVKCLCSATSLWLRPSTPAQAKSSRDPKPGAPPLLPDYGSD